MSVIGESAAHPADFIIRSPECLRRILAHMRLSRAMVAAIRLMANIQTGTLDITLPGCGKLRFEGKTPGPHGVLVIHNERVVRRFLTGGQLGFCEAYLDGDWSSPDIAQFFEFVLRNEEAIEKILLGKTWYRFASWLSHAVKPNSRRGSKKNIYSHYDIGNDFYAQWLDPSMTYSSAYFADGINDLEEAQQRKYEEMTRRLNLKKSDHVLEIGCGWGGFAEYAARNVGCRVTAVTISPAQHDYAVKRIRDAGLAHLVDIKLQDYRDIEGRFDKIASIEMFEAVGEAYWPSYFNTLHDRLKPGGCAVLQIITIHEKYFPTYRRTADYIQRYIFPGGMLPSHSALNKEIPKAGLTVGDCLSFGPDYARTLALWNDRFQTVWPRLKARGFDSRFKRLWEQYLCYCQAGFAVGTIDVVQLTVNKP